MRTRVETGGDVGPRVFPAAGTGSSSSSSSSSSSASSSSSPSSSSESWRLARILLLDLFVFCEVDDCFLFLAALALAERDVGIERFCGVIDGVREFERDDIVLEF